MANAIVGSITILIVGIIINIQNQPMPENIGGMLTAVISALVGSVATFLGRLGSNNPEEQTRAQQRGDVVTSSTVQNENPNLADPKPPTGDA